MEGFQKYLIDNGWKRYAYEKRGWVENYERNHISSMGDVTYKFAKDGKDIYYGLHEIHHPPRWSFDSYRKYAGLSNEEMITHIDEPEFTPIEFCSHVAERN